MTTYNTDFSTFWRLYNPLPEYCNRRTVCERRWAEMTPFAKACIIRQLTTKAALSKGEDSNTKNPYFFLEDWRPPRPQFLNPGQQHAALMGGMKVAIVHVPQYNSAAPYQALTEADAEFWGFPIHHWLEKKEE